MNPNIALSALQNDASATPPANMLPMKVTSGLFSPTNKDVEPGVRPRPEDFFAVDLSSANNAAQQMISDNHSVGLFDTLCASTEATVAAMADPTVLWWALDWDCHIFEA